MTNRIFLILLAGGVFLGCPPEKTESPTKGSLHILIAESVAPPLIREVDAFLAIYGPHGAQITYEVVPSEVAVSRFILDTTRLIFTTIALDSLEEETVRRLAGSLRSMTVAYEGLAAVVHHRNPVDRITTTEIRKILAGTLTRWEQLSYPKGQRGRITLHLQDGSDASAYLRAHIPATEVIRARHRSPSDNLSLLHAVVADEHAIGFVGQSWIDSARVPAKALDVAADELPADTSFAMPPEAMGKFFAPHPAHVHRNYYPLKRRIMMLTKSLRGDLASGFGTFVANKEGQRIFLEVGLVPATQPIRLRR
ncbi:MAG: substrate-binding domain-containing protein [Bacteroidota bacterium]